MSWKRSGKVEVTRKLKALHFFILSIKDFGVFFVFAPIRRDIDTRRDFVQADTRQDFVQTDERPGEAEDFVPADVFSRRADVKKRR